MDVILIGTREFFLRSETSLSYLTHMLSFLSRHFDHSNHLMYLHFLPSYLINYNLDIPFPSNNGSFNGGFFNSNDDKSSALLLPCELKLLQIILSITIGQRNQPQSGSTSIGLPKGLPQGLPQGLQFDFGIKSLESRSTVWAYVFGGTLYPGTVVKEEMLVDKHEIKIVP